MNYHKAKAIADRIVEILGPNCSKIHIAGSIRRERFEVKDIEVVAIPSKILVPYGLFGEAAGVPTAAFKQSLERITNEVVKGKPDGRYMRIKLKGSNGAAFLDLFMPEPADYYRQLAIRTGSSRFSNQVIAYAWNKKGWRGTDHGLRRVEDCESRLVGDKTVWKCTNLSGQIPPVWESEEAFFDWLEIKWVYPSKREILTPNLAI